MCHEQKDMKCLFTETNLYLEKTRIFPAITDILRELGLLQIKKEKERMKTFEEQVKQRTFNFESSYIKIT